MTRAHLEELSKEELLRELSKLQEAERRSAAASRAVDPEQVAHELYVHQVELEMQNRELRESQQLLEESRSKYADLYDFAPVGYCTLDQKGLIREINLTGAALLGSPREHLLDRPFASAAPLSDRPLFRAHLKACAETDAPVATELTFAREGRVTATVRLVSIPEPNLLGADKGYRTALIDISAPKQLEDKLRFLDSAGETLAASLDYPDTVRAVAGLAVPFLADLAFIDVLDEQGEARRVEVAFADPQQQAALGERLKQGGPPIRWPTVPARAVESKEPLLLAELSRELRAGLAYNEEQRRALEAARVTSAMVVPLWARGRPLGVLTFLSAESGRRYAPPDLFFAEDIARRGAMAIDNARLHALAQRAILTRDDLLAVVSHDLRSPLGVILGHADLMLQPPPSGERRAQNRKPAEAIHRSAERMNRLIGDLLDAASIESGHLSVEKARHSLGLLLGDLRESLEAAATRKSLRLAIEVADDFDLCCDRQRVLQVFANLVGNAIKFTPKGGTIILRAESHGDEGWFSVTDTGPGIPKDDVPYIFDRFWQAKSTARLGTGLGLAISKGIIEAHGGRIWVETAVGLGATFFFTLPLAPAPSPERAADTHIPLR